MNPSLDSRTWVGWGLAVMLPLIMGRNPIVLAVVLIAVLSVRLSCLDPETGRRMGWFLRLAGAFVAIGVLFNVLTVRAGSNVIATLPESWPIIGGDLTWNALVYGVISGVTLFALVLTGITVASLVSWADLFHHLPARLAPIAVSGSIAWSFLPQLAVSWRNIREAHTMRGHRLRSARDIIPLVTPLLATSLDQALTTAEVLEARGFGASARSTRSQPSILARIAIVVGLAFVAGSAYGLVSGRGLWAAAGMTVGVALVIAGIRGIEPERDHIERTRLREAHRTRRDSSVIAGAAIAAVSSLVWTMRFPEHAAFRTYPDLSWPIVEPFALIGLALLLLPAYLAPRSDTIR